MAAAPLAQDTKRSDQWISRPYRHVPRQLIERPETGFDVPLGDWLKGPLCGWAENLISEKRLRESGLLDAKLVRRRWQEHLSGRRNWQYLLWNVLMFEAPAGALGLNSDLGYRARLPECHHLARLGNSLHTGN